MDDVRVPLGAVMATPGALAQIPVIEMALALSHHARGDWGDLCKEDWRANNLALLSGARILSSYVSSAGVRFWIITEAGRSSTCILLPEEY